MQLDEVLEQSISETVRHALAEDVGTGDITARLLPVDAFATAEVITRESAVLCGRNWVDAVYRQLDPRLQLNWLADDGEVLAAGQRLLTLSGAAGPILTGERTSLNFLQTLSGTATTSRHYSQLVSHTGVTLLDTRKTIPGLRLAQKYAVRCGGCSNHRMGLYDGFLIKENHIAACGSIAAAVKAARQIHASRPVEVEVENGDELRQAIDAGADIIMLDDFTLEQTRRAVELVRACSAAIKLESSGGIANDAQLVAIAETGVDYISMGALTKHCRAIDLSMRLRLR